MWDKKSTLQSCFELKFFSFANFTAAAAISVINCKRMNATTGPSANIDGLLKLARLKNCDFETLKSIKGKPIQQRTDILDIHSHTIG